MTAAERYRQLEISPSVQVARWIFNNRLNNCPTMPLREVVESIKTGKTPSKDEKKYYENGVLDWFKPSEIGEGKYLTSASDKVSQLAVDTKQATIYQPGTLLIIGIGAGIGRLAITKNVASSNQQITGIAFNNLVLPEYAYYYFLAHREFFYAGASKSTIPIINQKKITAIPFVVCSAKEQKTVIDFLAAIELIELPQDVEGLSRLTDDAELLEAARRIFSIHFAAANLVVEFDKQETHLTQLRQALLREAMQGQLLPQDPTDEPAAVLLQQLQAAAKPGKKGRGQAGTLFTEEAEMVEGPFAIPAGWAWCTLGEVASKIGSGSTPKAGYVKEGVPFFRSQNIYEEGLELSDVVYINSDVHQSMRGTQVQKNDVLLNITGGSLGRATLVTELPSGGNVSQHVCIVRSEILDSEFLHKLILSPYFQDLIFSSTSGAGRQGLPKYNLEQFLIPLPPLAEQQRIVAQLAQLLQHCDALEQRIRESRRLAEQLLATALREALASPPGTALAAAPAPVAAAPEPAAPRRRGRPARPAAAPLFD